MVFSASTIVGSGLAGSMYTCVVKSHHRSFITAFSFAVMTILLMVMKNLPLVPDNKWAFMLLIGATGFIIGGGFNSLITIESSVVSLESGIPVDLMGTIMMTGGTITIGVMQLIIAVSTTKDPESIFLIFVIFSCIILALEVGRTVGSFWLWRLREEVNSDESD